MGSKATSFQMNSNTSNKEQLEEKWGISSTSSLSHARSISLSSSSTRRNRTGRSSDPQYNERELSEHAPLEKQELMQLKHLAQHRRRTEARRSHTTDGDIDEFDEREDDEGADGEGEEESLERAREKKNKETATEIYGFVGYLISFVVYGMFLAWAYLPESVLCQMGLSYYPSKYWAIAGPTWFMVAFCMVPVFYTAFNLISSAQLDSNDVYTHASEPLARGSRRSQSWNNSIPSIADIPLTEVNRWLYYT